MADFDGSMTFITPHTFFLLEIITAICKCIDERKRLRAN